MARNGSVRIITPREAQVADGVAKGWTNKHIASHLQISARTVQTHLERMFRKLGVRSRAELVAQTIRNHGVETQ